MTLWASLFKAKWATDEIPDLSGKVIIVTGGNAGIGKYTVKALLMHNAKVYMASRTPDKMVEVIDELKAETGKEAIPLRLDLADLRSVRAAAEEFMSKERELHVLYNNAGSIYPRVDEVTADGYDLQFGTNVLGHFYFTKLLLPVLLATSQSSPKGTVRVINLSSLGHTFAFGIDYASLKDGPRRRAYNTLSLYFQSKFGNLIYSNELHRRYADQGIVSIAIHPGTLKIDTRRHSSLSARALSKLVNPVLDSSETGALTQLWAGTMPEGAECGGKYLVPVAQMGTPRAATNDPDAGKKLWEWLEEQVKDL
ncbi:NAD(P)-binding protein [Amylocystis lapponica]|nr:NAD(P)-binding protein [Amylocystis lapponica]